MHRVLLNALSTGWIEQALGVSRATVANWRRGEFPERRRAQLAESVRSLLGDTTKEPPGWAGGLLEDVPAIRSDVEKVATELAILRALLEARQSGLLQPDDDPVDDPPPRSRVRKRDR